MDLFLNAFTGLLVIIDPIGVAVLYAGLTSHLSDSQARATAIKGVIIATFIGVIFGLFGQKVLDVLGISIGAFRIAGGAFLFTTAYTMVVSQPKPSHTAVERAQRSAEEGDREDFSVFPLAIPLLAGPGCVTTIILLMSNAGTDTQAQGTIIAALLLVNLIALVCLIYAKKLASALGKTGSNILARVFGIILAALSVQFMADGIKQIFFS